MYVLGIIYKLVNDKIRHCLKTLLLPCAMRKILVVQHLRKTLANNKAYFV